MSEMYWITRICVLEELLCVFILFSCIGLLGAIVIYVCNFGENEELAQSARRWAKRMLVAALSFIIMYFFIPSKKDMALIIAGGAVYDYIQKSDEVKKLPDNAVKALNDWLTEDDEK